jgi:hypothetical protein
MGSLPDGPIAGPGSLRRRAGERNGGFRRVTLALGATGLSDA